MTILLPFYLFLYLVIKIYPYSLIRRLQQRQSPKIRKMTLNRKCRVCVSRLRQSYLSHTSVKTDDESDCLQANQPSAIQQVIFLEFEQCRLMRGNIIKKGSKSFAFEDSLHKPHVQATVVPDFQSNTVREYECGLLKWHPDNSDQNSFPSPQSNTGVSNNPVFQTNFPLKGDSF